MRKRLLFLMACVCLLNVLFTGCTESTYEFLYHDLQTEYNWLNGGKAAQGEDGTVYVCELSRFCARGGMSMVHAFDQDGTLLNSVSAKLLLGADRFFVHEGRMYYIGSSGLNALEEKLYGVDLETGEQVFESGAFAYQMQSCGDQLYYYTLEETEQLYEYKATMYRVDLNTLKETLLFSDMDIYLPHFFATEEALYFIRDDLKLYSYHLKENTLQQLSEKKLASSNRTLGADFLYVDGTLLFAGGGNQTGMTHIFMFWTPRR